jgi:type II secretory pathway pseudopilin PulG
MGQNNTHVGSPRSHRAGFSGRHGRCGRASRVRAGARSGFALIETLLGLLVLVIGLGAGVLSLMTSMGLGRIAREQSLALQAAESVLEAALATPFEEVFARFNGTNVDDPDPITGPSPGDRFDVFGLTPMPGEASVGRIFFPGDGFRLRENANQPLLGMPRDLNLDGAIDDVNHADDYRLLPMLVRVRWRSAQGEREVSLATALVNRAKVTE